MHFELYLSYDVYLVNVTISINLSLVHSITKCIFTMLNVTLIALSVIIDICQNIALRIPSNQIMEILYHLYCIHSNKLFAETTDKQRIICYILG